MFQKIDRSYKVPYLTHEEVKLVEKFMDQISVKGNSVMYNGPGVKSKIAQRELDEFASEICKTCLDQPGEALSFADFTLCGSDGIRTRGLGLDRAAC